MEVKIHKGDTVEVITGKSEDKGKRGEVIRVLPNDHRLVVQGVNVRTKHQHQVQSQGRTVKPGKVRFEAAIDISNVMLVDKEGKPTRLGVSVLKDGTRVRLAKRTGETV